MVAEFPLTGSGIGTFYSQSPEYHLWSKPQVHWVENAHNYYVQLAAELGLPALAVYIFLIYALYRGLWRAVKEDRDRQGLAKGVIFGLGAYLLTMLTSHHLLLSDQQFLFWFTLAAATTIFPWPEHGARTGWNPWNPGLWALGIIFLVLVGYVFRFAGENRDLKVYEYGLHPPEMVQGQEMRWSMGRSGMRLEALSNILAVHLYAPQGQSEVEIFVEERLLERLVFSEPGFKYRYYLLPGIQGRKILIETRSKPVRNPFEAGISTDPGHNRKQSVALDVGFLHIRPRKGLVTPEGWSDNLQMMGGG